MRKCYDVDTYLFMIKLKKIKANSHRKTVCHKSNMSHRQESWNQHTFFNSTNDYIDKYNIVIFKAILQKLTFRKGHLHQLKGEIFVKEMIYHKLQFNQLQMLQL